jgi:hypothetical protein
MTGRGRGGSLYRIVVQGHCETLLTSVAEPIETETCRCGNTRAVVPVSDESALWGLLDRIADCALHIVGLQELSESALSCGCQQAPGPPQAESNYTQLLSLTDGLPPVGGAQLAEDRLQM